MSFLKKKFSLVTVAKSGITINQRKKNIKNKFMLKVIYPYNGDWCTLRAFKMTKEGVVGGGGVAPFPNSLSIDWICGSSINKASIEYKVSFEVPLNINLTAAWGNLVCFNR